jgi:hypothetical protein
VFRLNYKDYDSENGIMVQSEKDMNLNELIHVLDIDKQSVALITIDGNVVKDGNTIVPKDSTVCIFPPLPMGG